MSRHSIDVVIVNYRGAADTLQALARLADWPYGTLWLVDNSAHEPDMAAQTAALQQATADHPCVRLLAPGANLGFGCACNLAFAQSSADYLLLLNPDARISTEDVLRLAQTMQDRPRLAGVSPKIYWNEQRSFALPAAFAQTPWYYVAQALATRSRRLAQWAARRGLLRTMRQMAGSEIFGVDFVAGSVLLLRRSAVLQAGGLFDPDYFMFFEDSDLSLRLRRAGYELAIVPDATAEHEYRHKAFKAGLMEQSQQHYFNKQYPLFYRWSGKLSRVPQLAGAVDLNAWFKVLAQPVNSPEEFARQTGGAGVLAFSPTMLLMPAIFRPSVEQARPFDAQEWGLLEPGPYTALLVDPDSSTSPTWVYFRKA
ncbi:MAG: glycosyltransferase [Burkholderiales bacterium]|nr:glycosyltransferase [Burkholderiales bacterium]